jgi:magnesium transporter
MSAIINCVAYADGRRVGPVDLAAVDEILEEPEQFVWIGLHEPAEDLLRQVQEAFDLHDLAIEDARQAHQRPKLELYSNQLFVVLQTAQLDRAALRIQFGETHVFLGEQHIVVVRRGPSTPYSGLRTRIEAMPRLLRMGPGFVLYALADFIVDQYFPIIDALEEELERLEEEIFSGTVSRQTTTQIHRLQHELLHMKRAIAPLIEICNKLMRFDLAPVPEELQVYFRDVYDQVLRVNEMVDNLREMLNSDLEANFSLISMTQNEVMKKFAAWAALIAIPTMIAGIYGMNFQNMPELRWRPGYPVVIGAMIILCVFLYYRFKRAGWI